MKCYFLSAIANHCPICVIAHCQLCRTLFRPFDSRVCISPFLVHSRFIIVWPALNYSSACGCRQFMRPNIGAHFHGNFCRFFSWIENRKTKFIAFFNWITIWKWNGNSHFWLTSISTARLQMCCHLFTLSVEFFPFCSYHVFGANAVWVWIYEWAEKLIKFNRVNTDEVRRWWIICRVPQPHGAVITNIIRRWNTFGCIVAIWHAAATPFNRQSHSCISVIQTTSH